VKRKEAKNLKEARCSKARDSSILRNDKSLECHPVPIAIGMSKDICTISKDAETSSA